MTFTSGHALIIGVGSYPKLPPRWQAPRTASDAQALAAALTDPQTAGYPDNQVILLRRETATKAQVLNALDTLAKKLTEGDTFVFFYSGHGHYGRNKSYYLTTSDTEIERVSGTELVRAGTGISQAELLEKLRALKAKKVLLIFNACHSGELMPTLGPGDEPVLGANVPEQTGKALLGTGEGRVLLSSCRTNQFSFVGSNPITLFTQAFIEGLQGIGVTSRGGYISIFDLYGYVYDAVVEAVRTKIPEEVRAPYGGTQEPTLTIIQQVGPFPIALYRGQETTLGAFQPTQAPIDTAVTEVSMAEAKSLYRQLVLVNGDMNRAGGDIVYGDKVGGDKISGDKITVGDITGSSGIAIGRGARASIRTGLGSDDLATQFAAIYKQIAASAEDDAIKETVTDKVKAVEAEAAKGEQADDKKIEGWLKVIAKMMPDILEVTANTLLSPISGIATVVKKVAAKAKIDGLRS